MYWETLPNWFWIIYYLFLFATLGAAIISVAQNKAKALSIITIVLTITVPMAGFINSVERSRGVNEFEHLVNQFQQGAYWSIYTMAGYLYLVVWWGIFLSKK
ncbi:hypothetical protein [Bacillus sp. J33]|uniref:hypothetical protein n=1 Tax=Bacillus sp. J33 TaxID=935836 RepID=UPI00047BA72B|nr:hypothetical protein [Bacillus sp. J33]